MKTLWLQLDDARAADVGLVGGKAMSLHHLHRMGVPVPAGMVFTTQLHDQLLNADPEIHAMVETYARDRKPDQFQAIRERLSTQPDLLAITEERWKDLETKAAQWVVRSSATVEDGSEHSFAGIFESILNITTLEQFRDGLVDLYAASCAARVLDYCEHRGLDHGDIRLAIVVQQMVPSIQSGVAFTVDPASGDDRIMRIETVLGMGEAMVQGIVNPSSYLFNWRAGDLDSSHTNDQHRILRPGMDEFEDYSGEGARLSLDQLMELSGLCLKIQAYYGCPQDIEWVWSDDGFAIVQSRPITSIQYTGDEIWTTADFKDGGIASATATCLMRSIYKSVFDQSMDQYLYSVDMHPPYKPSAWTLSRFGILYWNAKGVKDGVMRIPGFTEKQFDQDLGIQLNYEGDGQRTPFNLKSMITGISILLKTRRSVRRRSKINKKLHPRIMARIQEILQSDLRSMDQDQLFDLAKHCLNDLHPLVEGHYLLTVFDNSNCKTLFKEKFTSYEKKKGKLDYLKLVSGIPDISHLRPMHAMWELRTEVLNSKGQASYYLDSPMEQLIADWEEGRSPLQDQLSTFIQKFGYHSEQELDISTPHWDEAPRVVLQQLVSNLQLSDEHDPQLRWERQHQQYLSERERIRSKSLLKELDLHRDMLWWREEMRDASTRMYHLLRKLVLLLGTHWTRSGILNDPEEVFHLSKDALIALGEGKQQNDWRIELEQEMAYYRSFRNFTPPTDLIPLGQGGARKVEENDKVMHGIPSSAGTVEAEAIVINEVSDIHLVTPGKVLVTRFTDPAWTSVFSRISGLITETGGVLSHGAIVSREYGIPAVLGVENSTQRIKSGMKVRLDGNSGTVEIIEDE